MVKVSAGPYKKGLYCETDTIPYDYLIGKYEITNKQFVIFLETAIKTGEIWVSDTAFCCRYSGDSLVRAGEFKARNFDSIISYKNNKIVYSNKYDSRPAVNITWYGAMCFCNKYNMDLPTNNEWEKAARGINNWWFPWGNNIDSSCANYYRSNSMYANTTTPVGFYNGQVHNGFKTYNAQSAFGCYDMGGNAWEWVKDFWGRDTPYHIGKGGGYHYHSPAFLQVYYISCYGPSKAPKVDMNDIADGFRVVKRIN